MMGKNKKPDEFKFEIVEYLGSLKESNKHDWCKSIAKISWNDNPPTLDIRSLNLAKEKAGKGISLSDEEADTLTDILLEQDHGSMEALESAIERKKSRFSISENDVDKCFKEPYVIEI